MHTLRNLVLMTMLALGTAQGGVIGLTFDQPDQTGIAGDTLHFFGLIANTGPGQVFLNGNSLNLTMSSATLNDLFLANVPLFLDGDTDSGTIELFEVSLSDPRLDVPGVYSGTYTLLGGADDSASEILGTWNFSITIEDTSAGVPEPGTGWMVVLGVAGVAASRLKWPARANGGRNESPYRGR